MVSPSPTLSATKHRWHGQIEDYTPSGAIGRLLIAILCGPLGILSLYLGVGFFAANGFLWLPIVFFLIGVGIVAGITTIATLWPVYLSLIGNVESARSYSQADTISPTDRSQSTPIESLKYRYATGDISDEEFEQGIENLLRVDEKPRLEPRKTSSKERRKDSIQELD